MNHNNSGLHCRKALGTSIPPISTQHDRVVGQLKISLKSRLQLHEISRLFPLLRLFRFCTALFTYGGSWRGTRGITRVFPQHACLLSHTHPNNSRPSIAFATYGLLTKCEVKMAGYWPSSFFA